jgi:hypothetical protein
MPGPKGEHSTRHPPLNLEGRPNALMGDKAEPSNEPSTAS